MTTPVYPDVGGSPWRFADLAARTATGSRLSAWFAVEQEAITAFGHLTRDPDRNHIDAEWATRRGAFGGPIAFGFQSLAMLTFLAKSAGAIPEDATHVVNYGFDRVRFLLPVPAGARVRGRFRVEDVTDRVPGEIVVTYCAEILLEHGNKPALVASWLALYQGEAPAP